MSRLSFEQKNNCISKEIWCSLWLLCHCLFRKGNRTLASKPKPILLFVKCYEGQADSKHWRDSAESRSWCSLELGFIDGGSPTAQRAVSNGLLPQHLQLIVFAFVRLMNMHRHAQLCAFQRKKPLTFSEFPLILSGRCVCLENSGSLSRFWKLAHSHPEKAAHPWHWGFLRVGRFAPHWVPKALHFCYHLPPVS